MATTLVTGAAGFIGFHVARRLLSDGHRVVAVDNFNDYYDPALKRARVEQLGNHAGLDFERLDLRDRDELAQLFARRQPQVVIHLAAQAGVRHSLRDPHSYVDNNVVAFLNLLEACRHHGVEHLVYASSSSVYGSNSKLPFSVHDGANHPLSLYAATKRADELMAHSYSHLYGLPTTGLRFFTVYGPWGRPDMAYFSFAESIVAGRPIKVFGDGSALRDFTYIDDIVEGVVRTAAITAQPEPDWAAQEPDPASSTAPYRLFNIGKGEMVPLRVLIDTLEHRLARTAVLVHEAVAPGDVAVTNAEVSDLHAYTGFTPRVSFEEGMAHFVAWFKDWYRQRAAA